MIAIESYMEKHTHSNRSRSYYHSLHRHKKAKLNLHVNCKHQPSPSPLPLKYNSWISYVCTQTQCAALILQFFTYGFCITHVSTHTPVLTLYLYLSLHLSLYLSLSLSLSLTYNIINTASKYTIYCFLSITFKISLNPQNTVSDLFFLFVHTNSVHMYSRQTPKIGVYIEPLYTNSKTHIVMCDTQDPHMCDFQHT